ncbi:MAG: hypothetical protein ACPHRO_07175 [Nannocystaceae bacterium]
MPLPRSLRTVAPALVLGACIGCSSPLTEAECHAFADHIIELAANTATELEANAPASPTAPEDALDPIRARGEARRAELVERCSKSPRAAFDCAMAADSVVALRACKR